MVKHEILRRNYKPNMDFKRYWGTTGITIAENGKIKMHNYLLRQPEIKPFNNALETLLFNVS